jgi:hypothetical protein
MYGGCVLCMAVGKLRWKSRLFVFGGRLGGRRIYVSYDLTFPLYRASYRSTAGEAETR